jgi:hypothetical protein
MGYEADLLLGVLYGSPSRLATYVLAFERNEGRGEVLLLDILEVFVSDDTGGIKFCSLRLKRGMM